jgi:hypothetical protein
MNECDEHALARHSLSCESLISFSLLLIIEAPCSAKKLRLRQ